MIIARAVKIVPTAAGEWDNTSSAITTLFTRVAYNIFLRSNKKKRKKKNNDKQQFSPVRHV
jgi:hypothetical protein